MSGEVLQSVCRLAYRCARLYRTEAAAIATSLPDRAAYLRVRADDHLRRARAQRERLRELGFVDREIEDLESEVSRER
mgnify:CR=1 FL=1